MSLDNFPRDAYESWDDVGLVYTRNKYGRLSSPPGYGLKNKNDRSDYRNSLFKEASCSVNTGADICNPYSLFLICLDFVAKNISMVESLEEFPDIVGEQLFNKVQENKGFDSSPKNLKLFCEAYSGLVLSKLSLSSEHIVTSNYLENLQVFVFLTELDVSHCRLGDTHELLACISHMHGLEKLSLKDNCLSDAGVKKFTLPCRLLKDGLGKLSVLDLSVNPKISDSSIKYLVKTNSLTALNLSGTGVSLRCGVTQLVDETNLCLAIEVDCFKSDKAFTVNKGWAVDLVNSWVKKSKNDKTNDKTRCSTTRGNFYKSTRSEMIQNLTQTKEGANSSELPVIMLTLKENHLTCSQSGTTERLARNFTRIDRGNYNRNGQPRKKRMKTGIAYSSRISSEESLEDDLFKEYLNYNKTYKPEKKCGSLLESLDCVG